MKTAITKLHNILKIANQGFKPDDRRYKNAWIKHIQNCIPSKSYVEAERIFNRAKRRQLITGIHFHSGIYNYTYHPAKEVQNG